MVLIADSGSTKTAWCLISKNQEIKYITSLGINPFYQTETEIESELKKTLYAEINTDKDTNHLFFYGAGCADKQVNGKLEALFHRVFNCATAEVSSDMLGAARGLFKHEKGIACILGTGSNSAEYDGENIIKGIPAGGFILGDEGSGAVLGKNLIADYIKNQMPENTLSQFKKFYNGTYLDVVNNVYKQPFPNRWLANFTKFMYENRNDEYIHNMLVDNFMLFFSRNISQFDGWKEKPVGFIGSIAHYFREELQEAASRHGISITKIYQNPLEGLIEYHTNINEQQ